MSATTESSGESIQERLERLRKERESRNTRRGVNLGDEEEDLQAWVERTRKAEEEKRKKRARVNVAAERNRARQAKAMIDQYEQDADADYGGFSLKGAKVSHDIGDFEEGQEIVLTLKDSSLLNDKSGLNDDEDELENVNMAEADRLHFHKEAAKKGYNVYDEIETGDHTDVLKKYDEPTFRKEGFRLEGSNTSTLSKEERLAEVRKKLGTAFKKPAAPVEPIKTQYSLNDEAKPMGEYLPQTFKKKRRRKKVKSSRTQTSISDIAGNTEPATATDVPSAVTSEKDADHGSRNNQGASDAVRKNQIAAKKDTKAKAYQKAIEKAKIDSLALLDEEDTVAADDDEVYETLRRPQNASRRREVLPSSSSIASQVRSRQRRVDATTQRPTTNSSVIFTHTGEFCRNIEPLKEKKKKEAKEQERMQEVQKVQKEELDEQMADIQEEIDVVKHPKNMPEEVSEAPIEEEILVGDGLMGALKLLQRTKDPALYDMNNMYAGRRNDAKASERDNADPAPDVNLNHYDNYGRLLTVKERFRKLSHSFHGKGPSLNKLEKEQRRHREEMRMRGVMVGDTPLGTVQRMNEEQKRTGKAFIELSAAASVSEETRPVETPVYTPTASKPAAPKPSVLLSSEENRSFQSVNPISSGTKKAPRSEGDRIEFGFTGSKRKGVDSPLPPSKMKK